MSTQQPEPSVQPSSPPDGPQVVPTHGTPEGEPGPDPENQQDDARMQEVPFENEASNPNSAGPAGLAGDMGVSSERTGPDSPGGVGAGLGGIEGTGSRGGAVQRTDGEFDTSPTAWDATDVSQRDLTPIEDDPSRTTRGGTSPEGIDKTVGEPQPDPIQDEKLRRRT